MILKSRGVFGQGTSIVMTGMGLMILMVAVVTEDGEEDEDEEMEVTEAGLVIEVKLLMVLLFNILQKPRHSLIEIEPS